MDKFFKKLFRLYRYKHTKITPIYVLEDCISQLAALYAYSKGKDYRESQRDILNLRIAEIKQTINEQLAHLQC